MDSSLRKLGGIHDTGCLWMAYQILGFLESSRALGLKGFVLSSPFAFSSGLGVLAFSLCLPSSYCRFHVALVCRASLVRDDLLIPSVCLFGLRTKMWFSISEPEQFGVCIMI